MQDSGTNAWEEFWNSGSQLSQAAGEKIRKAGDEFWTLFFNADKDKREDMLRKMAAENDAIINSEYERLAKTDAGKKAFADRNINNASDFAKAVNERRINLQGIGMTKEEADNLMRDTDRMVEFARATAKAAGLSPEQVNEVYRLFDLFRTGNIQNALDNTANGFDNVGGVIYDVIGAATGASKAVVQLANAQDYLRNVAGGAAVDSEKFNEALQTMGYEAGVTLEAISNMYKGAYSGAQNSIFAEASAQFDDYQQRAYEAEQKRLQGKIDRLDAEGERLQKSQERDKDALDKQHDNDKKAFDKSWDAREKRETDYYDNKIKAIDAAIEAEQKAEEIRQRIFEAEKTRIQRMAQLFSDNIDINMAINSGNLDEAAKLSSNSQAQVQQWAVDDQMALSGDASKNRIDKMQDQKDAIEAAKKARLEALEEIKKKDEEVLQDRIDRENDALKATQETARKEVDARKKAAVEKNKNDLAEFKKTQDAEKKRLDQSVEALKATLPQTQEEYEKQGAKLQEIYKGYLGQLKVDGTSWATFVSTELTRNMNNESTKMHSNIAWDQIGKQIANDMLKGAFNMDANAFAEFINGGKAPVNSLFGSDPKPYQKPAQAPPRPRTSAFGGRINDPNAGALHTGGPVTMGGGGRVGKSGELKPTEVNKTLLVGEGVVNRRAMRLIGKAGLDQINSGGGMGGGATLGLGSVPAAFSAMTGKMLIQKTMQGAYDKAMGRMGTYVGSKSGVQGPGLVQTVQNIAGAALGSQPAYRSGQVVYLGHGTYKGGANLGVTARPADGRVVSEFGPRNLLGMTFHNGIDIANAAGTPIKAAARGRIVFTGWDDTGYGNYVQMQAPDGTMFGYGHNSTIGVRAGQQVFPGQIIARMGSTGKSTGPHSHFQTGRDGKWFNPRALFPQLKNGGFTMNEGLANLHPKETVITAPLTEKFKQGVDNFANSGGGGYNVTMNFAGAHFETTADIEQAVLNVHYKLEKKRGVVRKVGQ
jgi:murein DD-endopeptidase MepM/ murein hydrolase activator NlpD